MKILEKCKALFGTTTAEQTKPEQPIIVKPLTKQEQPIQAPQQVQMQPPQQQVQMQAPPQQVQMQKPMQQPQNNTIWNLENALPQDQPQQGQMQGQQQMQGHQCPQHAAGQPCQHHGPAPQQKPMPKPAQNKTITQLQKKEPAPEQNKAPEQKKEQQALEPIYNLTPGATTILQQKPEEQKGDVNLELRNKIKKTVAGALGLVFGLSFLKNVSSGLVLKSDGAEYRPEDFVKNNQATITGGTICGTTCVDSSIICSNNYVCTECLMSNRWCYGGDMCTMGGDLCSRNAANNGWCDICGDNICGATNVCAGTLVCAGNSVESTCGYFTYVCAGDNVLAPQGCFVKGDGCCVLYAHSCCCEPTAYIFNCCCSPLTAVSCAGCDSCFCNTGINTTCNVIASGYVCGCQGYFCDDSGACNLHVQGCCQSPAANIYNCCCDALHVCSDGGYGLMAYSNNYYPICAYSMSGCQAIMGNGVNSCGYQGCDCCVPYDYMGSQYYLCFCGGIFVCQSM